MSASAPSPGRIRRPRSDDRPLWDISFALWGYPAVLVAHQMKLFDLLNERPRTLAEVCDALKIERRPAEALLAVCTSLGFARLSDGSYSLTPLAEDYLLPASPSYYGWALDAWTAVFDVWSPESIRQAVLTNHPQGPFGAPQDAFAAWHAENAVSFTRAMHSLSMPSALAWPERIDLSRYHLMLDIGGGSGAHSIGAADIWPNLQAVILDVPVVCGIAQEFIREYGLEEQISTRPGNFFADPFPEADVHFYGMIFHDWPPEKCRALAAKSFQSLPPGGRIIVHEMLFNDDRTGPFAVAAFNVDMLAAMPGQQYSGREIAEMLAGAGFENIEIKPAFGYFSIVTGRKNES